MKLTNAMRNFIDEYVEQNMPEAYDAYHCGKLELELREELGAVERAFRAEVQECVSNFVERHPEFEGVEAGLSYGSIYVTLRNTSAAQARSRARDQRTVNKDLIIKRMYASVGMLKTMEELTEAMDALLEEFKE